MGKEVKVNSSAAKTYAGNIRRSNRGLSGNRLAAYTNDGYSNYAAISAANTCRGKMQNQNLTPYIDKLARDCNRIDKIAEKYKEFDKTVTQTYEVKMVRGKQVKVR